MNLLFFINSLSSGGAERVTATLANYWAAKGWDVTIVTLARTETDFTNGYRDTAHRFGFGGTKSYLAVGVINNLRRVTAVYRLLRLHRPDVAIAMMPTANVTLALAGRLAGVEAVGSERIYPPSMPLGRFWEAARRHCYPLLSHLVAQTVDSATWLRDHAGARRISVIPNPMRYPLPCHPPQVAPETVRANLVGAKLLLAVGRLAEQKGFDRLLSAFAKLAPLHPDWSLVILGEGSERDALTMQTERLGLEGRVAFVGAIGNVGDWFATADAFVMTSRFEGFPNTLLEAMAYGVPSLAVDCLTGPRELICDELNGLLVPRDDPEALKEALGRLLGDAGLRARLAARAVETRDTFAVARVAEQWEELLFSLTNTTDA